MQKHGSCYYKKQGVGHAVSVEYSPKLPIPLAVLVPKMRFLPILSLALLVYIAEAHTSKSGGYGSESDEAGGYGSVSSESGGYGSSSEELGEYISRNQHNPKLN